MEVVKTDLVGLNGNTDQVVMFGMVESLADDLKETPNYCQTNLSQSYLPMRVDQTSAGGQHQQDRVGAVHRHGVSERERGSQDGRFLHWRNVWTLH